MAQNVTFSGKGKANAAHGLGCPQRQLSFSHAAAFGILEATLGVKPDRMAAKSAAEERGLAGRGR